MLSQIWFTFLYQPLFNALVWLYSNLADFNLGWAVIYLTIGLRLALLPLTIISERNVLRQDQADKEAEEALRQFKNDSVAQKNEYRRIIKKYKISPWAKVVTLLIQVLVLVLLYQVFMRGIIGDKMFKILYASLDYPGKLNVIFYGHNIGLVHDSLWAGIAALYLFVSIFIEHGGRKRWSSSEAVFAVAFPLFTFLALWWLPMVKSLFILTTMIFSDIITMLRMLIFPVKKTINN